jgi:hypothetical protein
VTKARILLAKKDPSGALAAVTAALKLYETSYAQAVRGEALQATVARYVMANLGPEKGRQRRRARAIYNK